MFPGEVAGMKTVILCGGYGTRIREVAENIPKPMVPIGGLPIIWHIMKYFSCFGHQAFVLCLGYKGNAIKDFFINYKTRTTDFTLTLGETRNVEYHSKHSEDGWQITFAETGLDALTGARVARVKKYVAGEENFMLTYGDGVGDVDLKALIDFHHQHGKVLTVTGVRPPGRFGELELADDGQVVGFNEKPQASGGRISGGFFVCRKEIFDYLDDREDLIFERDPMEKLVSDGQMMMFQHDGFWHPMDTPRDYRLLNQLSDEGKAPWIKWD